MTLADGQTEFTGGLAAIWSSQTGTSDAYEGSVAASIWACGTRLTASATTSGYGSTASGSKT